MRLDIIIASLSIVSSAVAHPHAHARFHSLGKKAISNSPAPANADDSMQDGMMYTMDMPPNDGDNDGIMHTMETPVPASENDSGKKKGKVNGKKSSDSKSASEKTPAATTAGSGKNGSPTPATTVTKDRHGGKKTKTAKSKTKATESKTKATESPKATKSSGRKKHHSANATTTESARGGKKTKAPKVTQTKSSSDTKKSDDIKRGDAPKVKVGIVDTESGKNSQPKKGVITSKKTGIKNGVQTPASGNSGSASSTTDSPGPVATNSPTGGSPRTKPCCCCDTSVMKTLCKRIPFDQECYCLSVTCDPSGPV